MTLAGCADNPQVRGLAGQIGEFAKTSKAATDDFKTRYDRYNGQLQDRVTMQDAGTAEVSRITARQTDGWALAKNNQAADANKQLTVVTGDAIVVGVAASASTPAALDAGNFDAQMTAGMKAAASLAQKPSTLDNLMALAGTLQTIDDTLKTLQAKAAKAAPTAAKPAPAVAAPAPG
ncbi:MAG: hypothetical protein ACHP84_00850 [Caulobacterales bacterium]